MPTKKASAIAVIAALLTVGCPRPADDEGTDDGANETTGQTDKEKPPQT